MIAWVIVEGTGVFSGQLYIIIEYIYRPLNCWPGNSPASGRDMRKVNDERVVMKTPRDPNGTKSVPNDDDQKGTPHRVIHHEMAGKSRLQKGRELMGADHAGSRSPFPQPRTASWD